MSAITTWGLSHPILSMAETLDIPLDYAYAIADFIAHNRDDYLLNQAIKWAYDPVNKGLFTEFVLEYTYYWIELNKK